MNRRFFIKTVGAAGVLPLTIPLEAAGLRAEPGPCRVRPADQDRTPERGRAAARARPSSFEEKSLEADFCVVGGGMAGLCAAVAAARRGAATVLMQDRPVLGGNASSEIRMHICGAHGSENRETGLLEEIMLENWFRNPGLKYTIWDTVLYETARFQENLTLLLNCSCNDIAARKGRIDSIRGWQLTTQKWFRVKARFFADCSGDSILRVCGAEFRRGREARGEFGESHAPVAADGKTMGNSILIQLREVDDHVPFVPPGWAHRFEESDVTHRHLKPRGNNFWWLEIGGEQDTIADGEEIRDELLKIAFGVWDYIKNHPDGRGRKWELDWIGALPGKRENVRYVGDHILTQNDVEAEGRFDDLVAYGGWSMDDHHPAAFRHRGAPTIFHPAPSPFGIPYRSLYSRNVDNLFFAGRNISATHMAMSATRVMATCSIMGQAAGTAAALAVTHGLTPRGVFEKKIAALQQALMDDDCWLPWRKRAIPEISRSAVLTASAGDPEPLRNGVDRKLGKAENGWWGEPGAWVEYRLQEPRKLSRARFVFDSRLSLNRRMPCSFPRKGNRAAMPGTICRDFDLLARKEGETWRVVREIRDNHQRLVKVPLDVTADAVRFVPRRSWGGDRIHLFAFDLV